MIVQKMPMFPGGEQKMMEFIRSNVCYPDSAKANGIQGVVHTTFVVTEDGKIEDVKILRGISKECDEEATRVIKMMPDWIPGEDRGKFSPVRMNLPIKFKLK